MDFELKMPNHSLSPALIAIQAQFSTVLSICHGLAVNEKHGCLQLARQLCADIRRSIDVDSERQLAAIGLDDVQAAYGHVVFNSLNDKLNKDYNPIGEFDVPLQFASEDSAFLGKSFESSSLNSLDFGTLQDSSLSTSINVASSSEPETGFKNLQPLFEPLQTVEDSSGTNHDQAYFDIKPCWDANLISDFPPIHLPPITLNSSITDLRPATLYDQVDPNGQVASFSGSSNRQCGTGPDYPSEVSNCGDSFHPVQDLSDSNMSYLFECASVVDSNSELDRPSLCDNLTQQIISPIDIEDCSRADAVTTIVTGDHVTTTDNAHINDLQMERCGSNVVNGAKKDCGLLNSIDKNAGFSESSAVTTNQLLTERSPDLINRPDSICDLNQMASSDDAINSLVGSECGSKSLVESPSSSSSSSSANTHSLALHRCRWCPSTSSISSLIDCPSSLGNGSGLPIHLIGCFQSKTELERHIAMMHPDYLAKQCSHCDFTTKNRQNLWKHVKRKHRILNGTNSELSAKNKNLIITDYKKDLDTLHVDNVSGNESEINHVDLFSKFDEHRDDPYVNLTLNSLDDGIQPKKQTGLEPEFGNSHCKNSITPVPVDVQKLVYCSNGTFGASIKSIIVLNRTNKKEFKCKICEKVFNAERNLKRHCKLIHSEENPAFRCGCGKSFKMLWQLKRHFSGGKKVCRKLDL